MAEIVAEANLFEIQEIAKYPDWLGYIGLVIHYCKNPRAIEIITNGLLPQFIKMVENDKIVYKYLISKRDNNEFLTVRDLSSIEIGVNKNKNY